MNKFAKIVSVLGVALVLSLGTVACEADYNFPGDDVGGAGDQSGNGGN